MLLCNLIVERVTPEYDALGQPVSYRLYMRSSSGWNYGYYVLHHNNRPLVHSLFSKFTLARIEQLQGRWLSGFVQAGRVVQLHM